MDGSTTSCVGGVAPAAIAESCGNVSQTRLPDFPAAPCFTSNRFSLPDHASVPNSTCKRAARFEDAISRTSSCSLPTQYAALVPEGETDNPPAYPLSKSRTFASCFAGSRDKRAYGGASGSDTVFGSTTRTEFLARLQAIATNLTSGKIAVAGAVAGRTRFMLKSACLLGAWAFSDIVGRACGAAAVK